MAQMGSILAGGAAAGVYTTNEASACEYVASHSDARVVFVEDAKQLAKYLTFRDKLQTLAAIVVWGGERRQTSAADASHCGRIHRV